MNGSNTSAWRDYSRETEKTTVVLTGLPKSLNAEILLYLLDREYFGCYDYFYLPMDEHNFTNTGIAYINFRRHDKAVECQRYFTGFTGWPKGFVSDRSCRADWSSIQGYEANIQRQQKLKDWKNSNIPEDCKPMVFDEHGLRLPFDIRQKGWSSVFGEQWEDEWYGSSGNGRYSGSGYGESKEWATSHSKGFPEAPVTSVENPISASLQEVEGPGYEEKDIGVLNPKLSELFDQVNSVGQISEVKSGSPKALLAVTRYACPSCSSCFVKWSACWQHILSSPKCRSVALDADVQQRCKAKAKDLPTDQANGKLEVPSHLNLRRFQ